MAEETDGRLVDIGDIIESDRGTFVVTGVQSTEPEGVKEFTYLIKNPADLIAEEEENNG